MNLRTVDIGLALIRKGTTMVERLCAAVNNQIFLKHITTIAITPKIMMMFIFSKGLLISLQ